MKQMNKEIAIKLANDSGGTWNRQLLSDRIQEVLDAKDTAREKALKEAVAAENVACEKVVENMMGEEVCGYCIHAGVIDNVTKAIKRRSEGQ